MHFDGIYNGKEAEVGGAGVCPYIYLYIYVYICTPYIHCMLHYFRAQRWPGSRLDAKIALSPGRLQLDLGRAV